MRRALGLGICLAAIGVAARAGDAVRAASAFDLSYLIDDPQGLFAPGHAALLLDAAAHAETAWETLITGYADAVTIELAPLVITILPTNQGLAAASYTGVVTHGGFALSTGGMIVVNVAEVDNFANWQGPGANGLNFLDELLAHETGHVLGIGTLWLENGAYAPGSYQYTGAAGVEAYRHEFDDAAAFVPVENAGAGGTAEAHWDQRMRSSVQEGNPADPWALDPRVGLLDPWGRDFGLELMTGAIDPDFGEPFFSATTVASLRDLGYTTTKFADATGDGAVDGADLAVWASHLGEGALAIDSFAQGDVDRDRRVAGRDFLLWQQAFDAQTPPLAIPEPTTAIAALASGWALAMRRRWRPCHPRLISRCS